MAASGDTRRVACPRCGANNFLGTALCWRCGASLPPPEEAAAGTPGPFAAANQSFGTAVQPLAASSRQPARPPLSRVLVPVIVLVLLGCVLALVLHVRRYTTPSPQEAAESLNALKERLMRQRGFSGYRGAPDESVEARAQAELRRLQRQLDSMRSGGGPGGPGLPSGQAADPR